MVLRSLLLFSAVIVTVSTVPCPRRCLCFKTTVRCMFLQLHRVPRIPTEATVLDLRFNRIRDIPKGTFKDLKNLNTLLLNNNHITRLQDGAFVGLDELRYLYLYKNKIKHIEPKAFFGLPKLEQLYLHYNRLSQIRPGTFDDLHSVQRLFMHNNNLQKVPHGGFYSMKHLRRLRLDNNALICDCDMMWLARWLRDKTQAAAICSYPSVLQGKTLANLPDSAFKCKQPELEKQPEDVDAVFGGTTFFSCKADGNPNPDISWYHNRNKITFADGRMSLLSDGTLMIKDTQSVDEGYYECMAVSSMGQVKSRRAVMRTRGKPRILEQPSDQSVTEGETVTMKCRVEGYPPPVVMWRKDRLVLQTGNRFQVTRNGTLRIQDVTSDDSGQYECVAANYLGREERSANIVVKRSLYFTVTPSDVYTSEESEAVFRCVAEGVDTPEISWRRNDQFVSTHGRITIADEGQELRISSVLLEDSGVYTCIATSKEETISAGAKLVLLKSSPPVFSRFPSDLHVPAGGNVELTCEAHGFPKPVIVWKKDGAIMNDHGRFKMLDEGSMRIYNVSTSDTGVYECDATNSHGEATAKAQLRVQDEARIDNNLVHEAIEAARSRVDLAVEHTRSQLFDPDDEVPRTPSQLLRLFRFPTGASREVARAREIYEQTLQIIKTHVDAGLHFNLTEFRYEHILNKEQLELLERLSGCTSHRDIPSCSDMCFHSKYRRIDGTCNNLQNPLWGASLIPFRRLQKPVYENGFNTPVGWKASVRYYGYAKPSSRLVSSRIMSTDEVTADPVNTHMLMQWGQFLDHDIDHALPAVSHQSFASGTDCSESCEYDSPCFPISIPDNDNRIGSHRCMEFIRSSAICGSGATSVFSNTVLPREQVNTLTSFIDGSQVYGSTEEDASRLRDERFGFLRTGDTRPGDSKPLLPYNLFGADLDCRGVESPSTCFYAGDVRANEHLGLTAMHTLWMREHNRIAAELGAVNPEWRDEKLYQETRKVVGAMMQHITYDHWLPNILGPKGMEMMGQYKGYDPSVNPTITNVFATAAFRFGHSLIFPILHRLNNSYQPIPEGNLPLHKAFFAPWRIVEEGGIDPLLRGLAATPAKQKMDSQLLNSELTEQLFSRAHLVALDLAAMNIQRGRDHALPEYNVWRKFCNLSEAHTFNDLRNEINMPLRDQLQQLYGHPGNLDLWVGGLAETPVEGAKVGPTFLCMLVQQFKNLRDGDRLWYENPGVFEPPQLTQIKQSTLGRVMCDSGDAITHVNKNVFVLPRLQNGYTSCHLLPRVDLRVWKKCCQECEKNEEGPILVRSRRQISNPLEYSYIDINGERIEGIESVLEVMQKEIRQLNKKVRRLQVHCGLKKTCKDSEGKRRKVGETWKQDPCTTCECQKHREAVCETLQCPELPSSCQKHVPQGECCAICNQENDKEEPFHQNDV